MARRGDSDKAGDDGPLVILLAGAGTTMGTKDIVGAGILNRDCPQDMWDLVQQFPKQESSNKIVTTQPYKHHGIRTRQGTSKRGFDKPFVCYVLHFARIATSRVRASTKSWYHATPGRRTAGAGMKKTTRKTNDDRSAHTVLRPPPPTPGPRRLPAWRPGSSSRRLLPGDPRSGCPGSSHRLMGHTAFRRLQLPVAPRHRPRSRHHLWRANGRLIEHARRAGRLATAPSGEAFAPSGCQLESNCPPVLGGATPCVHALFGGPCP